MSTTCASGVRSSRAKQLGDSVRRIRTLTWGRAGPADPSSSAAQQRYKLPGCICRSALRGFLQNWEFRAALAPNNPHVGREGRTGDEEGGAWHGGWEQPSYPRDPHHSCVLARSQSINLSLISVFEGHSPWQRQEHPYPGWTFMPSEKIYWEPSKCWGRRAQRNTRQSSLLPALALWYKCWSHPVLSLNHGSPTHQQCELGEICLIFLSFSFLVYEVGIKLLLISKGYCGNQVT